VHSKEVLQGRGEFLGAWMLVSQVAQVSDHLLRAVRLMAEDVAQPLELRRALGAALSVDDHHRLVQVLGGVKEVDDLGLAAAARQRRKWMRSPKSATSRTSEARRFPPTTLRNIGFFCGGRAR
jgi:hypothetical protein